MLNMKSEAKNNFAYFFIILFVFVDINFFELVWFDSANAKWFNIRCEYSVLLIRSLNAGK